MPFSLSVEPKATDEDGVWKLPDGDAYYAECLCSNTTTSYSPEQVHEIGLKEVRRIEAEMKGILETLGYHGVANPPRKLAEFTQGGALPVSQHG